MLTSDQVDAHHPRNFHVFGTLRKNEVFADVVENPENERFTNPPRSFTGPRLCTFYTISYTVTRYFRCGCWVSVVGKSHLKPQMCQYFLRIIQLPPPLTKSCVVVVHCVVTNTTSTRYYATKVTSFSATILTIRISCLSCEERPCTTIVQ